MIIQNMLTQYPNKLFEVDKYIIDIESISDLLTIYEGLLNGQLPPNTEIHIFRSNNLAMETQRVYTSSEDYHPPIRASISAFERYLDNDMDRSFDEVQLSDEDLKQQFAIALGILPEIDAIEGLTVSDKLSLSQDAKLFYDERAPFSNANPLPSYQDIMNYRNCNSYEKRLIVNQDTGKISLNNRRLLAICKDPALRKPLYITHDMVERVKSLRIVANPADVAERVRESASFNDVRTSGVPERLRKIMHTLKEDGKPYTVIESFYNSIVAASDPIDTEYDSESAVRRSVIKEMIRLGHVALPDIIDKDLRELHLPDIRNFLEDEANLYFERIRQLPEGQKLSVEDFVNERAPLNSFQSHFEQRVRAEFVATVKGHRAPQITPELVATAYDVLPERGEALVKRITESFNLDSVSAIVRNSATQFNKNLIALSFYLNFSQVPAQHIQVFASVIDVDNKLLETLVQHNFFGWYNKHKNIGANQLLSVLNSVTSANCPVLTDDMTYQEVNNAAFAKMISKEEETINSLGFDFSKNDIAIKGRDIVVQTDKYKVELADKDDKIQIISGYLTGCCQHVGTQHVGTSLDTCAVGGSCVLDIISNPVSANLIVRDRSDNVIAQSYVRSDIKHDGLILDNIEYTYDNLARDILPAIYAWVAAMPQQTVHVGTGYNQSCAGVGIPIKAKLQPNRTEVVNNAGVRRSIYSDYDGSARALKQDGKLYVTAPEATITRKPLIPSVFDDERLNGDLTLLSLPQIRTVDDVFTYLSKAADTEHNEDWVRTQIKYLCDNKLGSCCKFFGKLPNDLQDMLYRESQENVLLLKEPHDELLNRYLTGHPQDVCKFSNISENTLNALYSQNGLLVRQYPTDNVAVQEAAVRNEPLAIKYLGNSTAFNRLLGIAINKKPEVIKFYPKAGDWAWERALSKNPDLIIYKEHTTKAQRQAALRHNPALVYSIQDAKTEDFVFAKRLMNEKRHPSERVQALRSAADDELNAIANMI